MKSGFLPSKRSKMKIAFENSAQSIRDCLGFSFESPLQITIEKKTNKKLKFKVICQIKNFDRILFIYFILLLKYE